MSEVENRGLLNCTFDDKNSLFQYLFSLLDGKYIFRGINSVDSFLPKAVREGLSFEKELSLLDMFEKYYGLYYSASDCWEFLALAQHCGLYTRLIDFTENPFVALFFSLYNPKSKEEDQYQIVICDPVDPVVLRGFNVWEKAKINERTGMLTLEYGRTFTDNLEIAFRDFRNSTNDSLILLKTNYRSNRMLMQNGLFVVPRLATRESALSLMETQSNSSIITVDETIRESCLEQLDKMGINEFSMMPDINSACLEINRRVTSQKAH